MPEYAATVTGVSATLTGPLVAIKPGARKPWVTEVGVAIESISSTYAHVALRRTAMNAGTVASTASQSADEMQPPDVVAAATLDTAWTTAPDVYDANPTTNPRRAIRAHLFTWAGEVAIWRFPPPFLMFRSEDYNNSLHLRLESDATVTLTSWWRWIE